jgi:hypothetical protein
MSGGYEETESGEIPALVQKLLDLGVPKESVQKVIAVMDVECLRRFEKWKKNIRRRRKHDG